MAATPSARTAAESVAVGPRSHVRARAPVATPAPEATQTKPARVRRGAQFMPCACGRGEVGLCKGQSVKSGGLRLPFGPSGSPAYSFREKTLRSVMRAQDFVDNKQRLMERRDLRIHKAHYPETLGAGKTRLTPQKTVRMRATPATMAPPYSVASRSATTRSGWCPGVLLSGSDAVHMRPPRGSWGYSLAPGGMARARPTRAPRPTRARVRGPRAGAEHAWHPSERSIFLVRGVYVQSVTKRLHHEFMMRVPDA